jgi:hypothetical protein
MMCNLINQTKVAGQNRNIRDDLCEYMLGYINLRYVVARACPAKSQCSSGERSRRIESLRGHMSESARQACTERSRSVEGLFESLLAESFG